LAGFAYPWGLIMRRVRFAPLAAVFGIGFASVASAADLPTKAPVAPVAAPFSWTGFYVGGHAGYGWGNADVTLVPGPGWGLLGNPATDHQYLIANGSATLKTAGALGGFQAGYNFQYEKLVFGVEADFSFANIEGQRNTGSVPTPVGALIAPRTFVETDRLDWLSTFRGRVGYTVQENLLLYATGGLAVGHRKFTQTIFFAGGPGNANLGSVSATQAGWTGGAGLEYALGRNWTAKAEYLYVDLGTISAYADSTTAPGLGLSNTSSSKLTLNIARLGVSYKFDSR
jgi:outer membrane immunogenic protein